MAMHEDQQDAVTLGPNAWLVDEMYDQYLEDPNAVSESWREFFADYHHRGDSRSSPTVGDASGAKAMTADTTPAAASAVPKTVASPAAANGQALAAAASPAASAAAPSPAPTAPSPAVAASPSPSAEPS